LRFDLISPVAGIRFPVLIIGGKGIIQRFALALESDPAEAGL